jgi:hypothetical protein
MSRSIAARRLEQERAKELARKAAIESAIAAPAPPRVSKQDWNDWNRYGWFGCAARWQPTCSDRACAIGARCKRMADLGLAGDGSPLPRRDRPCCGAQTRKGTPCVARVVPGKTALPDARWTLDGTSNAQRKGTDRGGAAQAVGPT